MVKIIKQAKAEKIYEYTGWGTVKSTDFGIRRYTYIIGMAEEIKPIYKSMTKAWEHDKFSASPYFLDFPKFNETKMYGIEISWNGVDPYSTGINDDATFQIIGEHAIVNLLLDYFD